ncbi:hypothetical protein KKA14_05800 [bacterium]|nr:hypothetical protein [bacterium]
MICRLLFIVGVFVFSSCSSLPEIVTIDTQELSGINEHCNFPYVAEETQFIHSIEAVTPGNGKHFMTGITSVFPREEKLESALLTIEGLVLFHALDDKKGLVVKRAVPPFDSEGFARGLLEDIRLIFLKPGGSFIKSGRLKNGKSVCRYKRDDNSVVDIEIDHDNNWGITLYDAGFNQQRSIEATFDREKIISSEKSIFPATIRLRSYALIGYSLRMKLIRAESQSK